MLHLRNSNFWIAYYTEVNCGHKSGWYSRPNPYGWIKHKLKLSRGEICVANFIPPANGASQGNYFQAKIQKMAKFGTFLLALLAGGKLPNGQTGWPKIWILGQKKSLLIYCTKNRANLRCVNKLVFSVWPLKSKILNILCLNS